jgi:chaperonin cofactor prefoldin
MNGASPTAWPTRPWRWASCCKHADRQNPHDLPLRRYVRISVMWYGWEAKRKSATPHSRGFYVVSPCCFAPLVGSLEASMLEQRVAYLEDNMKDIKSSVHGIEVSVSEIAEQLALMNGQFRKIDDKFQQIDDRFKKIDDRLEKIDDRLEKIDNRFEKIDGQFENVRGQFDVVNAHLRTIGIRFNYIPTVWMMLTLIFATWGIGSGILLFAVNVLRK